MREQAPHPDAGRPDVRVAVISWHGMHEKAAAIAAGAARAGFPVDVIYSNHDGNAEDGAGLWHGVPQTWYFGWKFRKALELFRQGGEASALLVISADAGFADWASLVCRCADVMAADPQIGIWAPDLDVTPWPLAQVATAPPTPDGCVDVAQTDGVVWALSAKVAEALSALDYEQNNLGWGIDMAAILLARRRGLRVRRDLTCCIRHPEARGYDAGKALTQMRAFWRQFPLADQSWLRQTLQSTLGLRRAAEGLSPILLTEANMSSSDQVIRPRVLEFHAMDGNVYIATSAPIDGADICLAVGQDEISFAACAESPIQAGQVPVLLPFDLDERDLCKTALNASGEWQLADADQLRMVFHSKAHGDAVVVPVTRPVEVDCKGNNVRFFARLGVHRGRGNLVLRLTDAEGVEKHRREIPFQAQFEAGTTADTFQSVNVRLPEFDIPCYLHVELSYRGPVSEGSTEPSVFFIADPRLFPHAADHTQLTRAIGRRLAESGAAFWSRVMLHTHALTTPEPITLREGKDNVLPIGNRQKIEVRLIKDWGHVLEMESSERLTGMLWANGTPAFPVSLVQGHNVLRIPPKYLTGSHSRFEMRDLPGMQVFWQDWSLPSRQLTALEHLQRESRSPFASDLYPQTVHRYRALRAHCAASSPPEILAQLSLAIEALEAGHEALQLKPLKFPVHEAPDVSVVVPVHNKIKVTYAGLCALLLAWNKATFEVIVVDDASTDQTAQLETLVEGITVVRNETPQRFIRACNAGVAAARGKYVVLLNNDTEPTTGWLDELIAAFGRFENVGLVGSRLLYPDGTQQEAGGIIWGSGDPWNYGRLHNPFEPRFSYARQADYVSGAAMMTTREIWDRVGGLSSYLEPMYFEDTDFAFKIREAGLTVWYIPSSVVYHYEGLTSGTDTSAGFKRYQEVNRPKFKRRWAHAFTGFSKVGTAPDLEKDRGILGRVLFVDITTPTPDRDAGSYAAVQEIRLVQSLGYKVTFLPENLAYMGSYTEELQKMGVEMITAPFYRSIDEFLEARAAEFDAFYVTRYQVMNNVAPRIRKLLPEARIIMNGADLHYLRLLRRAIAEGNQAQIEATREIRDQEFAAMEGADVVLSYNETEHAVIDALSEGRIRVMKCPWVLELPESVPPRKGRAGLSFLGGFQHHPNVEGIEWFVSQVMARLDGARPDIRLSIYGSRMPEKVKAMASDTIDPVGYIEEVADAYDRHLVFVAPLLSGAGIKGKVLAAMAHGIPCVLSPVAAEATGLRDGEDCLIARTPQDWVEAITRLHDDAALWDRMSANARSLAHHHYSFERGREQMRAALEAVDLFGVAR